MAAAPLSPAADSGNVKSLRGYEGPRATSSGPVRSVGVELMRKTAIACASLVGLVLASIAPAEASKLYIREYKAITTIGATYAQIAGEPGTDQTPVDFSGGAASSSAVAGSTRFVRLVCDASCSYSVTASAGTATTNNALLPAGVVEFVGIAPGYFVNVRSNP